MKTPENDDRAEDALDMSAIAPAVADIIRAARQPQPDTSETCRVRLTSFVLPEVADAIKRVAHTRQISQAAVIRAILTGWVAMLANAPDTDTSDDDDNDATRQPRRLRVLKGGDPR